jgi:hypothetical protein
MQCAELAHVARCSFLTPQTRRGQYSLVVSIAQLPKAFWVYLSLTAALAGLATLEGSHVVLKGVVLTALLTLQMARRRNWAWTILMLLNTVPLLAVVVSLFAGTAGSESGHVVRLHHFSGINIHSVLLFLLLAALEWCLWSRSMRGYIDSRYAPRPPRPQILPQLRRS